jgi:type I restriction enzyme M protein
MLASELKSKINKLWDRFWSGGIANPLTAIEQMSYLIFMKRLEDLDNVEAKRAGARKQKHKSIFEGKEECRWSEWKHYNAPQMMEHVKNEVFPFIKNIRDGEKTLFSYHMQDAVFLIPKASLLQEAVAIIDELNITSQNIDTQGDMYEYLLSELKTAGKNGQFRTPRHIIRMIVSLVNPDIGDKICDPACGTAGFLINAYEHILKKYTSPDILKVDETGELHNLVGDKITENKHWKILWEDTFIGYDFDTTMVRISLMNMILHGIKLPKIDYKDTLSKRYEERKKYDVILANPPFKGSIDKNDINDNLTLKTTRTELLFVEQMLNLLVTGGKCGVIVPQGVLFGSSSAHIKLRKTLLETCQLDAVVSMPSGVFKPYAGVSTGIIIFTKGGKTEKVWFYDMQKDGYSLDDKRTFIDGKGDIPDIIERFENRLEEKNDNRKNESFFVPYQEIKKNDYDLSVSRYKEIEYEEIKYDSPKVIINKIAKIENKIQTNIKDLRKLI